MIVTPDKFQAMLQDKRNANNQSCLKINNQTIKTNFVKSLGINIDNKLNFDSHISDLCKKTSRQLNALNHLRAYIENKEMEILIKFYLLKFQLLPTSVAFQLLQINSKVRKSTSVI